MAYWLVGLTRRGRGRWCFLFLFVSLGFVFALRVRPFRRFRTSLHSQEAGPGVVGAAIA
jgi:hypothetical protein